MTIRVKEILDLMLLTIVLTVCLMTGVWTTVKESQEIRKYTSSYREKNTTQKYTPSIKVYGSYNGTVSKEELILISQIQDYEMYGPHVLAYADNGRVDLHPGYEMYSDTVRAQLCDMLLKDAGNTSYLIEYDSASEAYQIYVYYGICPGCGTILREENIRARVCFTFDCGCLLRCGNAGCEKIPIRSDITAGVYDRCSCGGYIRCPGCSGYLENGYCADCRRNYY